MKNQSQLENIDEEISHVPMLEQDPSLDPIHEYFDEDFEDQAPQYFIEEEEHEEIHEGSYQTFE